MSCCGCELVLARLRTQIVIVESLELVESVVVDGTGKVMSDLQVVWVNCDRRVVMSARHIFPHCVGSLLMCDHQLDLVAIEDEVQDCLFDLESCRDEW